SQDQTLQFNPTNSQFTDGRFFTSTSMDLSIRVIAINTFATRVAMHQGTHTYRLSKFLKISYHQHHIRQQQRGEIMNLTQNAVNQPDNIFYSLLLSDAQTKTLGFHQALQLAGCGGRI
ncbi:MAG: hypothetical protein ACM32G_01415, partial [Betaproteobacteria bacterium]